ASQCRWRACSTTGCRRWSPAAAGTSTGRRSGSSPHRTPACVERGSASLAPERLFVLEQFESLPGGRTERGFKGGISQSAFLVANGLVELASLGVSGGQGVDVTRRLPVAQLARRGRVLDCPFAVADLVVRARGQEPGERVVRGNERGLRLDGPEVS